jgi:type IV pilus assembly protein PilA
MNTRKRNQKGFSLIELLIVVSIMLVIAAIAVPAVIASNQAGNETAASHNLQQLVIAENGFHQLYGTWSGAAVDLGMGTSQGTGICPTVPVPANPGNPAANPPVLASGGSACLLPQEIALAMDAGTLSNYNFAYIPSDPSGWAATATPATPSAGRKAFWVDATGTIRYKVGTTPADNTAKPLGQ